MPVPTAICGLWLLNEQRNPLQSLHLQPFTALCITLNIVMDKNAQQALIAQAKIDPEAFGVIFDAHYKKILGYTVRRVDSVAAAEDIVAETFIKALKGLPKFRWQGVPIEAWLFRIATNEIRMYFRKNRVTVSLDELYDQDGYEPQADYDLEQEAIDLQEKLDRHQTFRQVQKLIHHLPIKYQEVLVLRFAEQKKVGEIAQILGKREGTVKSLLSRGLDRLRKELDATPTQPKRPKRIVHGEGRVHIKEEV